MIMMMSISLFSIGLMMLSIGHPKVKCGRKVAALMNYQLFGAPIENIVQNHLNIGLLNVF